MDRGQTTVFGHLTQFEHLILSRIESHGWRPEASLAPALPSQVTLPEANP
jgi:hypothetical protein